MEKLSGSTENRLLSHVREMQLSDDPEAVGFDKQAWLDEHEPYMQVRLEALGTNQERIDDLLTAYSTERRQLEMKYEQLLGPCYNDRTDIVTGKNTPEGGEGPDIGIPEFWLTVLRSHPDLEQRISEQDSLVLKHLVDIVGSHFCPADGCGSHGFVLKFLFSPNKYFSEDHLSIKVMFADEDEAIVRSIEGTSISWTSHSVNPTIKLKKKRTGKNSFKVRSEPVQSFFRLFSPTHQPSHVSLDMNEYTAMKQDVEDCLAIIMTVMDDMIPGGIKFYSGEKTFSSELNTSSDDDDDDGDEDDSDDDDDDSEDEEEVEAWKCRDGEGSNAHADKQVSDVGESEAKEVDIANAISNSQHTGLPPGNHTAQADCKQQ